MGRSLRYRGGLSFRCHKINNFEGTNPKVVNGQRIKHYISGNPINVETNIIETVTPEEYIRDTFRNVSDSEKEYVCGMVSKPTPKQFLGQYFSVLEYLEKQKKKKQSEKDTRPPRGWRARPTLLGAPPYLVSTSCAFRTPFSCTLRILVGKNSLYNLLGVLTPVSRKNLSFLF